MDFVMACPHVCMHGWVYCMKGRGSVGNESNHLKLAIE